MQKLGVSERRACDVLKLNRTVKRYKLRKLDDEHALKEAIIRLVSKYGRYGYRRITAMLKAEGWKVNHKRVERIWREEGLRVPKKTAEARSDLSPRWLMYQAKTVISKSCLVL